MLRGQMELPSEMLGLAVSEGIVVLTEEEYEALEAREQVTMPEAFAPVVCFDGEVWGVSLAGPNPEARHFITCACEGDARGLHEALEARKPQASAEVIERARRWAQQLRLWPRRATPTEDGLRLIPEDCLRRCSAAFDALLAAVEAAPDEERLTPIADMTLDEQIDELATYMPEQMPVLAVLLDEETLPKVLQSFRNREASC